MQDYTILREFADSWMLLMLFAFFVGVILWVFRPGSSASYRDTANIPFRHDNAPVPIGTGDTPAQSKEARQ